MQNKGIRPIVSEYHVLWETLKSYKARLENLSAASTDEDQQLVYDEKIQDVDGLLNSIQIAAKSDYGLNLE